MKCTWNRDHRVLDVKLEPQWKGNLRAKEMRQPA
jgi:hypothetical protein